MHFTKVLAAAAAFACTQAAYLGFNYDANANFQAEFTTAKNLAGTQHMFSSARLYTMIQPGTTNTPTSAIQAAINTQTTLLLGIWASAGQTQISNEIAALKNAINQYGTAFTSLIAGISVGSEDLYRVSPTGIENNSGAGATPAQLVNYIKQVRAAIAGTAASGAKIGHVDTWTAWVNGTNSPVIANSDWLGMDAYPYYETTKNNVIANAKAIFNAALTNTRNAAGGKPVWVTETGWPVSGPKAGNAVPSKVNAQKYWKQVACQLESQNVNTWWYILQDTSANPSFGVTTGGTTPLYSLTCPA